MDQITDLCVRAEDSIRQAMARIDRGAKGIVLLVDDGGRLEATITDGDVRRAILSGLSLDAPVADLVARKVGRREPATAPAGSSRDELTEIMREAGVSQLPLLDPQGRIVDLFVLDQLIRQPELPVQAVIMAGGFGKRLRPLTNEMPKPMLPIAGRPLMERTIEGLRQVGIHRIHVTTHYMAEKITGYFGNGRDFGVELNYVSEDQPLGTAGSLSLVGATEEPLLVINGDVLTQVDFRAMLSFHQEQKADLTVGVRQYAVEVPYGVIEAEGGLVRSLREKPKCDFLVNSGIYLLEPSVRRFIPRGRRYDMTDLIVRLLEERHVVASFPIVEYWLDIGRHDDFRQAEKDVAELRWAS